MSGNKITLDATQPGESASYETRTVDLVLKLKKLPALQSVSITPASGHNVEKFCPFSGGGDVYMFAKDFVVVLLTVEEDKDDDDYEDDNPSPQARQEEKENIPVPPPQKRELRCGAIENKVKTHQSLLAVSLQLQANMLLALVPALQGAIDKDPMTASTITLITCYGVINGPYPLVLLQSTIDFVAGTLIYEELCNHKRTASHFAWIDSALAHIVRKLVPV